jgi:hypothetical protein
MHLNFYIIILCVLFFGIAHFFVSLGILSRFAGPASKNTYSAHSIEKVFLLISSMCIACFAPLLAFLTERILSIEKYILLVIFSQIFALLLTLQLILFKNYYIRYVLLLIEESKINVHFYLKIFSILFDLKNIFKGFNDKAVKSGLDYNYDIKFKMHLNFFAIGFIINLFSSSGFFIAFFLASNFPDHKLTLAQSAVIIHGIGQVLQSLFADTALARAAEVLPFNNLHRSFDSYLAGRCVSFIFIALLFGVLYFSI